MIAKLFLIALTAVISAQAALTPALSDADCAKTHTCLGYPKGCQLASCDAFVKWTLSGDKLKVEMRMKRSASENVWVAYSASEDEDMDKNPTEFCYTTSLTNGTVGAGYHPAKSSPVMLTPATYISNGQISVTNTYLECRFDRALTVPSGTDAKYNLDAKKKYYALGGYGAMMTATTFKKHTHDFHSKGAMLLSGARGFASISMATILLGVSLAIKNFV